MGKKRNKQPPQNTGELYEELKNDPEVQEALSAAKEVAEIANQTSVTPTQGERKMAGLTAEQIQALMGASRGKGDYSARLQQFLNSGQNGMCVQEQYPDWADKKPETLKQGFENAKNSKNAPAEAEFVKVIKNEDLVYLINLKVAGLAAVEQTEAEEVAA